MQLTASAQLQAANLDAISDESLAARGDADSFVLLYRRYLQPVYSYLYARLGNREEAEDITAVAFEHAVSSLKGYRPTGSFAGWLFTIVRRALADYYRQRTPHEIEVEKQANALVDPSDGPEDKALASEEVRQVLGIIAGLGHDQQEIIALRFFAGLPYAEIARLMGKREAAVKMAAYRALDEIKRRCGDVHE